MGGRLARGPGIRADDQKAQQAVGRDSPGPGALGYRKVPAGRLPQAEGMEQITLHQEKLMTRKVASQTFACESGWWVAGGWYGYPKCNYDKTDIYAQIHKYIDIH